MDFVANFIRFPVVQRLCNRIRFAKVAESLKVGTFWDTVYNVRCDLCKVAGFQLGAAPLACLRSMIASTLSDACICKLHLYILAGCGKQQTRNDKLFIAIGNVCHRLLKTFHANFSVWHDPLPKVFFQKKTFQCIMTSTLLEICWRFTKYPQNCLTGFNCHLYDWQFFCLQSVQHLFTELHL